MHGFVLFRVLFYSLKLPEAPAHVSEAFILLDEPSSPSFNTRQPQLELTPTESSIQQP